MDAAETSPQPGPPRSGIFISYRQADSKGWCALLRQELVRLYGDERVFLDVDALHAGDWQQQIHEALQRCAVMLVVIGRHWLSPETGGNRDRLFHPRDVQRAEIAAGLGMAGVTVIPLLVDGAGMPAADELPPEIRTLALYQARAFSERQSHRLADLRELANDLARAGLVQDEAADSHQPARLTRQAQGPEADDDELTMTYVPRRVDAAQARRALAEAGGGADPTALALWWLPYWYVTAQVSVSWQAVAGPASARLQREPEAHCQPALPMTCVLPGFDGLQAPLMLAEDAVWETRRDGQAVDAVGTSAALALLEGAARAQARADFRAAARRRVRGLCDAAGVRLTAFDIELDAVALQLVWCPAWCGEVALPGGAEATYWVCGDSGEVLAGLTPAAGEAARGQA